MWMIRLNSPIQDTRRYERMHQLSLTDEELAALATAAIGVREPMGG
jgi:hypothetical protein